MNSPNTDVEISDSIQRAVERLAEARWITGAVYVSPRSAVFQLTALGKRKVQRLAKYLRPYERYLDEGYPRRTTQWQSMKVTLAICLSLRRAALMTNAEFMALIVLLAQEARKLREEGTV